jgi:hypothetical protein
MVPQVFVRVHGDKVALPHIAVIVVAVVGMLRIARS